MIFGLLSWVPAYDFYHGSFFEECRAQYEQSMNWALLSGHEHMTVVYLTPDSRDPFDFSISFHEERTLSFYVGCYTKVF